MPITDAQAYRVVIEKGAHLRNIQRPKSLVSLAAQVGRANHLLERRIQDLSRRKESPRGCSENQSAADMRHQYGPGTKRRHSPKHRRHVIAKAQYPRPLKAVFYSKRELCGKLQCVSFQYLAIPSDQLPVLRAGSVRE